MQQHAANDTTTPPTMEVGVGGGRAKRRPKHAQQNRFDMLRTKPCTLSHSTIYTTIYTYSSSIYYGTPGKLSRPDLCARTLHTTCSTNTRKPLCMRTLSGHHGAPNAWKMSPYYPSVACLRTYRVYYVKLHQFPAVVLRKKIPPRCTVAHKTIHRRIERLPFRRLRRPPPPRD